MTIVLTHEVFQSGLQVRRGASKGGKATAKLTDAQWKIVKAYIAKRVEAKVSAAEACREAAAQLTTGKFIGISRAINIGASSLQSRWTKRHQSASKR